LRNVVYRDNVLRFSYFLANNVRGSEKHGRLDKLSTTGVEGFGYHFRLLFESKALATEIKKTIAENCAKRKMTHIAATSTTIQ